MTRSPSTLAAIIINWNRRSELKALLEDIYLQAEGPDEVVVVDNASSDGSADMVAQLFPQVRLLRQPSNEGACHARNVAVAATRSELLVLLDNDLRILDRHFFARVRHSMQRHSDCGLISFYCLDGLWFEPEPGFPGEVYPIAELETRATAGWSPVRPNFYYYWFFFAGACVVRREVFETVGMFDEAFISYGDEWDLSFRCLSAGFRLGRDDALWLVHVRSPHARRNSNTIFVNMILALARYLPTPDLLLLLAVHLARTAWSALKTRQPGEFLAVWGEIAQAWRKEVAGKRRPVSRAVMRRFYFLRLHQMADYAAVEQATTGPLDFYRSRARRATPEQVELPIYAGMYAPEGQP